MVFDRHPIAGHLKIVVVIVVEDMNFNHEELLDHDHERLGNTESASFL